MKETTFILRIQAIADYYNMALYAFEKSCGLTKGLLANGNPSFDKIEQIIARYPDVNAQWLFTGKGVMILNDSPQQVVEEPKITFYAQNSSRVNQTLNEDTNNLTQQLIDSLREQIQQLKENIATKDAYIEVLKDKK